MRPSLIALLSATFATVAVAAAHATPTRRSPIEPGRYCLKELETASTGNGQRITLGYMLMEVTVKRSGSGYYVRFWNVMADNPQILDGEADGVRPRSNGRLVFDFTDGWGNEGRANLKPNGHLTLTMTKPSDEPLNQIGRNYGDYDVSRGACSAEEFQSRG